MISGKIPFSENERLNALKTYSILDSVEEREYDDITLLASHICKTPISLISLIDEKRQWFKSHHGLNTTETPREYAFCGHVINQADPFIISDSRKDERFFDNPLVVENPHVIFYAGVPLVDSKGFSLGTLCVIDNKPHEISENQIQALKALSNQVIRLFELRKNKIELENLNLQLEEQKKNLKHFAQVAAHDIKSPLNSMIMVSNMLEETLIEENSEALQLSQIVTKSSKKLSRLIDGILDHSKNSNITKANKTDFVINDVLDEVIELINPDENIRISLPKITVSVFANKIAVEQILLNLISNAIKYNDKDFVEINIELEDLGSEIQISVKDNGPGIDEKYHNSIFNIFEKLDAEDRYGVSGNGIGLATVKRLVASLEGKITLKTKATEGLTFIFTILK